MARAKPITWVAVTLYVFATVNAIQFYIIADTPYLNTARYLAGKERLPFQERVLPIPILKLFSHVAASVSFFRSGNRVFTEALFGPFLLSLISFAIATVFVMLLYRSVSRTHALSSLVAPLFLTLTMATYVIRPSARHFYPYDMPSLAFFAAGLFFIYEKKFIPLLFVVLVGTFNRETTLFLIVIYILDAVAQSAPAQTTHLPTLNRLRWRQIPWLNALCLAAIWLAIKALLAHLFAGNDRSEDYLRFRENLHRLTPKFLPSILNLCGYVLPLVYIRRKHLGSPRLAAWLLVVPMWIGLMFFAGVITETRIYGELIPLATVGTTLMLEERIARVRHHEIAVV